MKHHLNIILLALRVAIVVAACMAGYQFICFGACMYYQDASLNLLNHYFTPITPNYKYGGYQAQFLPWYCLCYGFLLTYFTRVLIRLRQCFVKFKAHTIFYEEQAQQIKRAGTGIILFAKGRYLLLCAFGAIFFNAIQLFVTEIPAFLMFYLLGKLVLVLHYMAKKGAFLREENELTI